MTPSIISVIVPTRNRCHLLQTALQSLANQSLSTDQFDVVVIDDGSVDATAHVCEIFAQTMRLKYFRLPSVGISAAKNLGIFASSGALTLFFDDDDVADSHLLVEHVRAHQKHPEEYIAVLGYTTWAPTQRITEVMNYLTEVGQMLFSYPAFQDGEVFGFTKFWGGRTSCKRSLLARHGVFNQDMPGLEDMELGFRLARHGLKVLYNRAAVSYMNRPVAYDEFCGRCEAQGACRWLFGRFHPDPRIHECLGLNDAPARWQQVGPTLGIQVERVAELEAALAVGVGGRDAEEIRDELHSLYRATFSAFFLKGTVDAMSGHERARWEHPA